MTEAEKPRRADAPPTLSRAAGERPARLAPAIRYALLVPAPLPRAAAWLALAAWLTGAIFIAAHHEQWRDEADAWLVARDASTPMFIDRASLGGTPELWHLILRPFARSGAPYGTQQVIHLGIAAASVALLLFRAPLPWLTRLAAAFSYYFGYEYAIIVRSYALSVLLLLVIAALHESRHAKPWRYAAAVALLANTNSHSLFIAAFVGMLFVYEALKQQTIATQWKPALLMLAGGAAAFAQLECDVAERATTFVRIRFDAPWSAFGEAFLPMAVTRIAPIAGLAVFAVATWWLRRDFFPLLFLWASTAALAMVFTFWWMGGLRHAGFLLVLLVCATWMHDGHGVDRSRSGAAVFALLTLFLLWSDVATGYVWRLDARYAFSGSRDLAAFLDEQGWSDRIIAAHSETTTSALAPYLRHPLWYLGIEEFGTFVKWDRKFDDGLNVPYPVAVHRFRRRFAAHPEALLLLNVEIPNPASERLTLLYKTRVRVFGHPDERYWLYGFARP